MPAFLLTIFWIIIPFFALIILSLYKTNFIEYKFLGFSNYVKIWTNKITLQSIANTCIYMVIVCTLQMVIGITISLNMWFKPKTVQDFNRIVYYIPTLSSGVIISSFWKWFFSNNGGLNYFLSIFKFPQLLWFSRGQTAIPAISFMLVLQNLGGIAVILSASILTIDKNTIEAAKIDGCTDRQVRWLIMLPQIKSSILSMWFLGIVGIWQMFETIYTVAPYEYASSIMFRVYEVAFQNGNYGEGSALSVLLVGVVTLITILSKKLVKL